MAALKQFYVTYFLYSRLHYYYQLCLRRTRAPLCYNLIKKQIFYTDESQA